MNSAKNNSIKGNSNPDFGKEPNMQKARGNRKGTVGSHVQILLSEIQLEEMAGSEKDGEPKYEFIVGKDFAK